MAATLWTPQTIINFRPISANVHTTIAQVSVTKSWLMNALHFLKWTKIHLFISQWLAGPRNWVLISVISFRWWTEKCCILFIKKYGVFFFFQVWSNTQKHQFSKDPRLQSFNPGEKSIFTSTIYIIIYISHESVEVFHPKLCMHCVFVAAHENGTIWRSTCRLYNLFHAVDCN